MKRQTLILVVIGLLLFAAGSALAYASVKTAAKHTGSSGSGTGTPATVSAVVAKKDIPAGTSGQTMISSGMVALQPISSKSYVPSDIASLNGLQNEVLTNAVQKGHAITSSDLRGSTSTISIPQGEDALTVAISGAGDLAGYLQPGVRVDIYANITKASQGSALAVPCTALVMTSIQVLDVQSTSPPLSAASKSDIPGQSSSATTGRTIPSSETLLLAVTASEARTLEFLSQNESLSVVQPQQEINPPPVGQCIGTDQAVTP